MVSGKFLDRSVAEGVGIIVVEEEVFVNVVDEQ